MAWHLWMLENVMTADHTILIPTRFLEGTNHIPAVHGGYSTYQGSHSQHYTHRINEPD
jgi:hypothetical protein